ncbi:class I SAM-dependent methyltransferase [Parahaliea mediterranea]|uniref:Class I SAM-dependent methyltransferase n=1 Tax=Parahaliea mediterranea TaxID=651086 RepID=A0A939IHC1_9GAMM|nr:class I SAM-dependent methyltransferase [Parahaliea mediterranea]MBN7795239.1 class I SAM-dependent methyltransferase [Parahaliea mediterranea]
MKARKNKGSYTSHSRWFDIFRQSLYSYHVHSHDIAGSVKRSIDNARQVERRLKDLLGVNTGNLDVLEIGPGQYLSQTIYFALHNRVTAIDLDVIIQNPKLSGYARMLRVNGARRTLKTLGRRTMGIDRRYRSELFRQLGCTSAPELKVMQMDATETSFADNTFDLVYSRAVFHHLPDPAKAVAEINRIVRPGGAAYIALHPYTNPTGCLDTRLLSGDIAALGMWPHLRSESSGLVRSNAYLNKLRIPDWRRLFSQKAPEVKVLLPPYVPDCTAVAASLHNQGQLKEYSVEELTAGEFVALWKKPASDIAPIPESNGFSN